MSIALAITGTGMVTAAGRGAAPAWEALCAGKSFLAPDPGLAGFAPIATARCAPLDPEALGADRRAARIMGRQTHMLLAGMADALGEAGGDTEGGAEGTAGGLRGEEVAFFAGMDSVDPGEEDLLAASLASRGGEEEVDFNKFFSEGMARIPPLWPLAMLNAIGFCQAAIQFGLRGENGTFSPGPEAGARAIIEGAESLREERARAALAAGVSPAVSARSVARYLKRGFLRPAAGGEAEVPEPFSGRGTAALGEGAGVILLEPLDEARASGKTIRGVLRGWARARALEDSGLPAAIRAAAEGALGAAGIEAGGVDLVIVHGGGDPEGDSAEAGALSGVFGGARPLALATKGAFGHLLGGSPTVDILLALRALAEGAVPPSPGAGEAARDVLAFPGRTESAELKTALVLCRGFEGECAAFALGAA